MRVLECYRTRRFRIIYAVFLVFPGVIIGVPWYPHPYVSPHSAYPYPAPPVVGQAPRRPTSSRGPRPLPRSTGITASDPKGYHLYVSRRPGGCDAGRPVGAAGVRSESTEMR